MGLELLQVRRDLVRVGFRGRIEAVGGEEGNETKRTGYPTHNIGVAMGYVGGENAAAGECSVRMWGYLPAASPQRTPLLQPTPVPVSVLNDPLKTVCNGGCGFGIAISGMQPDHTVCSPSTDDAGNPPNQPVSWNLFMLQHCNPTMQHAMKDQSHRLSTLSDGRLDQDFFEWMRIQVHVV